MIGAINSALAGLGLASRQVNDSAANIANVATPESNVDLAEEAIKMKLAEVQYKANVGVLKTAAELSEEVFRIVDKKV